MSFPRFKKQFWIITGLVIVILLVCSGIIGGYLVRFSATNEKVCAQCHQEIFDLWKSSKGHPSDQTGCAECHYYGRKAISGGWNIFKTARDQFVPSEYIADDDLTAQRCLDCHSEVLELGYKLKKRIINFSHRFHICESLTCIDCHRTAGHEYTQGGTNRPTALECASCHLKEFNGHPKSQKCLNCHDVMLAPGRTWTPSRTGIQ